MRCRRSLPIQRQGIVRVGSGLATGRHASPEIAADAVRAALTAAGLNNAEHVFLFLTRDFISQAQPALLAAARAATCMEISGMTASGVFTEQTWRIDQPAAAALVIADLEADADSGQEAWLSFSGLSSLRPEWQSTPPRVGLLDAQGTSWAHGRIADDGYASIRLPGLQGNIAHSVGLRQLGDMQYVEQSRGYELQQLGGQRATDSLRRALPAGLRAHPPWHQIVLRRPSGEPGIAILSANADGSLTMAAPLAVGEKLAWAIRQPLSAEEDMRQSLRAAVNPKKRPVFALMFSCIGRGPLFYGTDDHDLLAFREQFPGTPLLGAYGHGQIAPLSGGNALFQNSVITLLMENPHV